MSLDSRLEPRTAGIACALAATALGLFYLAAAGAPARYLVVNAAACLLGLVALRALDASRIAAGRLAAPALTAGGLGLLAVALLGASADGAARWIWIGPLSVQLSLVFLPAMLVAFARSPGPGGALGIAVAALALALQPDRAMAAVLAFALGVLAVARPGRFPIAVFAVSLGALAATFLRPDSLPAVPFVDRIFYTAFDVHPAVGAAVLLGALLLLLPAAVGLRGDSCRRGTCLVFAATWLGCLLAAALGNYPTPVVGYGGSAILGYLLSVGFLPGREALATITASAPAADAAQDPAALRAACSKGAVQLA